MNELYLKKPNYNELFYKKQLQEDPNTMEYNAGYDLSFEGYDKKTGCISFPKSKWQSWYDNLENNKATRFYAYVCKKDTNEFIGIVNFQLNQQTNRYECGVVVEGQYRGKGYGKKALELLVDVAFYEYNIDKLYDSFPKSRDKAMKTFGKIGFKANGEKQIIKRFNINEEIIVIELTKKNYEQLIK